MAWGHECRLARCERAAVGHEGPTTLPPTHPTNHLQKDINTATTTHHHSVSRRLIGVSVLQSAASALLAPSLRHVADMLALNWRERLSHAAFTKYLAGNTAYTASQLAGMQVRNLGAAA